MAIFATFLAVSALHGLLVYYTGSILPSMVLHTVADFIVIPIQYGIVGQPILASATSHTDSSLLAWIGVLVAFAIAAVPAFVKLARVGSRRET